MILSDPASRRLVSGEVVVLGAPGERLEVVRRRGRQRRACRWTARTTRPVDPAGEHGRCGGDDQERIRECDRGPVGDSLTGRVKVCEPLFGPVSRHDGRGHPRELAQPVPDLVLNGIDRRGPRPGEAAVSPPSPPRRIFDRRQGSVLSVVREGLSKDLMRRRASGQFEIGYSASSASRASAPEAVPPGRRAPTSSEASRARSAVPSGVSSRARMRASA